MEQQLKTRRRLGWRCRVAQIGVAAEVRVVAQVRVAAPVGWWRRLGWRRRLGWQGAREYGIPRMLTPGGVQGQGRAEGRPGCREGP